MSEQEGRGKVTVHIYSVFFYIYTVLRAQAINVFYSKTCQTSLAPQPLAGKWEYKLHVT